MSLRPADAWCSLKPNVGNLKYIRKECPRGNSACGYALAIAMHIHHCQIGLWVAPFVVIYPSSAFDKLNYVAMQDEQIVVFADRNPSTYRCVGASVRISLNEAHAMKISWSSILLQAVCLCHNPAITHGNRSKKNMLCDGCTTWCQTHSDTTWSETENEGKRVQFLWAWISHFAWIESCFTNAGCLCRHYLVIPTNHIKTVKDLHPGEADFALGNRTIWQLIMTTIARF